MADLEEDALKRDHGFVIKLIIVLVVGFAGGAFVMAGLTGEGFGNWAAESFGGVTAPP